MTRMPIVAGQFYSGEESALMDETLSLLPKEKNITKSKALGVICPHAGYIYSGAVAASVLCRVKMPQTIILIGPNHRGMGARFAIDDNTRWRMPTNEFEVDTDLIELLMKGSPLLSKDGSAHRFEHSLEVMLPIIATQSKTVKIVPISIKDASITECEHLGHAISFAIKSYSKEVLILASTDMSHYVSETVAKNKDFLAIERILKLDPAGLYNVVRREDISMCGYIPTTITLYAALKFGGRTAELVKYATSGDKSGDYKHVVGYAGLIIK